MTRRKIDISIPMLDFFMNLAFGVLVLLIVTLLLINPPSKKEDISAKADIMIIMDWPDENSYDIDLHMKTPTNSNVYFKNKDQGFAILDRDDLGLTNDTFQTTTGESHKILINREIMTLRSPIPGEYTIAVHLYNTKEEEIPEQTSVTVEIIELNPFRTVLNKTVVLGSKNDEKHIANLNVKDGKIVDFNETDKKIVSNISGLWRQ